MCATQATECERMHELNEWSERFTFGTHIRSYAHKHNKRVFFFLKNAPSWTICISSSSWSFVLIGFLGNVAKYFRWFSVCVCVCCMGCVAKLESCSALASTRFPCVLALLLLFYLSVNFKRASSFAITQCLLLQWMCAFGSNVIWVHFISTASSLISHLAKTKLYTTYTDTWDRSNRSMNAESSTHIVQFMCLACAFGREFLVNTKKPN